MSGFANLTSQKTLGFGGYGERGDIFVKIRDSVVENLDNPPRELTGS